MSKRFTDTEKWKKESFGDLSIKLKLVWIYLCDNCDHAGIWDFNLKLMSFQIGETVTPEELTMLGDKVQRLSDSKVFIPSFVEFQYGEELNPENRVHASVISKLKKLGASMPLTSPLLGAKDKDKEKVKDKAKEKARAKKVLNSPFAEELERIYQAYPRHEGKADGLRRIAEDIGSSEVYLNQFADAVTHYALLCEKRQTAMDKIKMFSSFISSWREYIQRPRELDQAVGAGGRREETTEERVARLLREKEDLDRKRAEDNW